MKIIGIEAFPHHAKVIKEA